VGGKRSPTALTDQIDERLADDDEHIPTTSDLGHAR
jgi:hypothetical protein